GTESTYFQRSPGSTEVALSQSTNCRPSSRTVKARSSRHASTIGAFRDPARSARTVASDSPADVSWGEGAVNARISLRTLRTVSGEAPTTPAIFRSDASG